MPLTSSTIKRTQSGIEKISSRVATMQSYILELSNCSKKPELDQHLQTWPTRPRESWLINVKSLDTVKTNKILAAFAILPRTVQTCSALSNADN